MLCIYVIFPLKAYHYIEQEIAAIQYYSRTQNARLYICIYLSFSSSIPFFFFFFFVSVIALFSFKLFTQIITYHSIYNKFNFNSNDRSVHNMQHFIDSLHSLTNKFTKKSTIIRDTELTDVNPLRNSRPFCSLVCYVVQREPNKCAVYCICTHTTKCSN